MPTRTPRPRLRAKPFAAASVTGMCLVLAAVGQPSSPDKQGPPKVAPEHQAKLVEAKRYAKEAEQLREAGKSGDAAAILKKKLNIERSLLGDRHDDVAMTLAALGSLHEELGDYAAARKVREEVLSIHLALHGTEHWQVISARLGLEALTRLEKLSSDQRAEWLRAKTLDREEHALFGRGRYRDAVANREKSWAIRKRLLGEDAPETIESLFDLAFLCQAAADADRAELLYKQARAAHSRVVGTHHPDYVLSTNGLAELYRSTGRYAEAEPLYVECLTVCERHLGDGHRYYPMTLNNLALLHKTLGRFDKAEPLYLRANDFFYRLEGEESFQYATSLNNLGEFYKAKGDYVQATKLLHESLRILKLVEAGESPQQARVLNNMGYLYHLVGDDGQAEHYYNDALRIREGTIGTQHPEYAHTLYNLGLLYRDRQDSERAKTHLERARTILSKFRKGENREHASVLTCLASLHIRNGAYLEAIAMLEENAAITKRLVGDAHVEYGMSQGYLGELYLHKKDY